MQRVLAIFTLKTRWQGGKEEASIFLTSFKCCSSVVLYFVRNISKHSSLTNLTFFPLQSRQTNSSQTLSIDSSISSTSPKQLKVSCEVSFFYKCFNGRSFPFVLNEAVQSQPVKAWRANKDRDNFLPIFWKIFLIEMYRSVFFPWTPASNNNTFLGSNWSMTPRAMISTSVPTVLMTMFDGAVM